MDEKDRFHHHPLLSVVSREDVARLLVKDRSYNASWKESGGRSAWHMVRRKIDRLLNMMRRPEPPDDFTMEHVKMHISFVGAEPPRVTVPTEWFKFLVELYQSENIFAMIRADPSGADGTVLAEVRDLRRYLLLVEAEMMAREVVARPETSDTPVITETVWKKLDMEREDPYLTLAEARGITRHQAKDWILSQMTLRPGTPEDGGHHARGNGRGPSIRDRLDDGLDAPHPSEYYLAAYDDKWIVDRTQYTDEQIDHLPRLQRELNAKEREEMPIYYRGLYDWSEGENKYVMIATYREKWAKSA